MDQKIKSKVNLFKLSEKKMKSVHAGETLPDEPVHVCYCACAYANTGGSSTTNNRLANRDAEPSGLFSPT